MEPNKEVWLEFTVERLMKRVGGGEEVRRYVRETLELVWEMGVSVGRSCRIEERREEEYE